MFNENGILMVEVLRILVAWLSVQDLYALKVQIHTSETSWCLKFEENKFVRRYVLIRFRLRRKLALNSKILAVSGHGCG